MYKGVLIHKVSYLEYYLEWIARGFGEETWTPVELNTQIPAHYTFQTIRSAQTLLFFYDRIDHRMHLFPNIPIIGIIIPVFAHMPDGPNEQLQEDQTHDLLNVFFREYTKHFYCPIIALVINGEKSLENSPYSNRDWWTQRVFSRPSEKQIDIPQFAVIECSIHDIKQMPFLLADCLELHHQTIINHNQTSRLPHPHIPNVTFRLENLGSVEGASIGFVEDCLEGLMDGETPFKIWIDLLKLGTHHYLHDNVKLRLLSDHLNSDGTNPFHVYLEYEGCAFDSMMAFQEPISIDDFQKRLNSTWRTHIDITLDMTFEEAKEKLNQVVQRVKYGKLEE